MKIFGQRLEAQGGFALIKLISMRCWGRRGVLIKLICYQINQTCCFISCGIKIESYICWSLLEGKGSGEGEGIRKTSLKGFPRWRSTFWCWSMPIEARRQLLSLQWGWTRWLQWWGGPYWSCCYDKGLSMSISIGNSISKNVSMCISTSISISIKVNISIREGFWRRKSIIDWHLFSVDYSTMWT